MLHWKWHIHFSSTAWDLRWRPEALHAQCDAFKKSLNARSQAIWRNSVLVLTEYETTTGGHRRKKAGPLSYTVPGGGRKSPASHKLLSQWWLGRLLGCIIKYFFARYLKLCSPNASSLGSDECPRTRRPNNLGALKSHVCRGQIGSAFHYIVYWQGTGTRDQRPEASWRDCWIESGWFRSRSSRSSANPHGEAVHQWFPKILPDFSCLEILV